MLRTRVASRLSQAAVARAASSAVPRGSGGGFRRGGGPGYAAGGGAGSPAVPMPKRVEEGAAAAADGAPATFELDFGGLESLLATDAAAAAQAATAALQRAGGAGGAQEAVPLLSQLQGAGIAPSTGETEAAAAEPKEPAAAAAGASSSARSSKPEAHAGKPARSERRGETKDKASPSSSSGVSTTPSEKAASRTSAKPAPVKAAPAVPAVDASTPLGTLLTTTLPALEAAASAGAAAAGSPQLPAFVSAMTALGDAIAASTAPLSASKARAFLALWGAHVRTPHAAVATALKALLPQAAAPAGETNSAAPAEAAATLSPRDATLLSSVLSWAAPRSGATAAPSSSAVLSEAFVAAVTAARAAVAASLDGALKSAVKRAAAASRHEGGNSSGGTAFPVPEATAAATGVDKVLAEIAAFYARVSAGRPGDAPWARRPGAEAPELAALASTVSGVLTSGILDLDANPSRRDLLVTLLVDRAPFKILEGGVAAAGAGGSRGGRVAASPPPPRGRDAFRPAAFTLLDALAPGETLHVPSILARPAPPSFRQQLGLAMAVRAAWDAAPAAAAGASSAPAEATSEGADGAGGKEPAVAARFRRALPVALAALSAPAPDAPWATGAVSPAQLPAAAAAVSEWASAVTHVHYTMSRLGLRSPALGAAVDASLTSIVAAMPSLFATAHPASSLQAKALGKLTVLLWLATCMNRAGTHASLAAVADAITGGGDLEAIVAAGATPPPLLTTLPAESLCLLASAATSALIHKPLVAAVAREVASRVAAGSLVASDAQGATAIACVLSNVVLAGLHTWAPVAEPLAPAVAALTAHMRAAGPACTSPAPFGVPTWELRRLLSTVGALRADGALRGAEWATVLGGPARDAPGFSTALLGAFSDDLVAGGWEVLAASEKRGDTPFLGAVVAAAKAAGTALSWGAAVDAFPVPETGRSLRLAFPQERVFVVADSELAKIPLDAATQVARCGAAAGGEESSGAGSYLVHGEASPAGGAAAWTSPVASASVPPSLAAPGLLLAATEDSLLATSSASSASPSLSSKHLSVFAAAGNFQLASRGWRVAAVSPQEWAAAVAPAGTDAAAAAVAARELLVSKLRAAAASDAAEVAARDVAHLSSLATLAGLRGVLGQ